MKAELRFKIAKKICYRILLVLFFLFFTNHTFGQVTRYVQAGYGMDMGGCTGIIPCATISYAIGQSGSGDVIEIANGTYTESIAIDKELTLNGESEAGTIIQAAEAPGMAENRVIFVSPGSGSEVSLSNLTIRYGSIVGDGAGIFQDYNSLLNLSNVTITENETKYDGLTGFMGGGLFSNGDSTLDNVTFSNNTAHGGAGMFSGSPFGNEVETTLTNVAFIGNIAAVYGGGLSTQTGSSATLTNVSFIENQVNDGDGGGIHNIFNSAQQVYKNVTFTNNVATRYGGGLYSDSSAALELVNTLFSGNSAEMGGAMGFFFSETPTLTNITINNNTATNQGGGIYGFFTSGINIINSIIWGNTSEGEGNEIYNPSGTNISYSIYKNDSNDIVGTINASSSLTEDPLFVDSENGNFRLIENSPAINTGDPNTALILFPGGPDDPLDLDNNPRVFSGIIDMGTYENQTVLLCAAPTNILVTDITSSTADISWTENGTATEWEIEYGELGFTLGEGITIIDNDGILGETISGLIPGVEYNAYVRSLCGENNSEWEGPIVFTTEQGGCTAPDSFTTGTITDTTAELSWDPVSGETNGYNWFVMNFGESPGDTPPVAEGTTEPGITWATATGLAPNTLYFVYLQTNCDNGEQSVYGGAFMIMTIGGGGECIPPSDITVNTVTGSVVFISWTENGDASQWEIEYGETGFTQGEGTTILDNDGIPDEAVSGLQEGINYDVYVRAICEFSASEWTGPVTFNTEEMGINELENQMVLYPNPTSGIINLQTKEKINSVSVYNAAGQKVEFKSLNQENTSIDISSLPGGIYFIELNLNNKTIKRYKVIRK